MLEFYYVSGLVDTYINTILIFQFQKPPARVPKRSICLATFLCFAGSSLLVFGLMVVSGELDAKVLPIHNGIFLFSFYCFFKILLIVSSLQIAFGQ